VNQEVVITPPKAISDDEIRAIALRLLRDEVVCQYVHYHHTFQYAIVVGNYVKHPDELVEIVRKDTTKDIGAIKLWNAYHGNPLATWYFVMAYKGLEITGDCRICNEPIKSEPVPPTIGEKATVFGIGHLLDITGFGLIIRLSDWSEKRREEKMYPQLRENMVFNPLRRIMRKHFNRQ